MTLPSKKKQLKKKNKNAVQTIRIEDYTYHLPDERIARFPLARRDESKLLLYKDGRVSESIFRDITAHLPAGSMLVFNNTRVIQARLFFRKETGAQIEVFCLEPHQPHDYQQAFLQTERCVWNCLTGNSKRWKGGVLSQTVSIEGAAVTLCAERKQAGGDSCLIEFSWDNPRYTFAELLEWAGTLPIPPYLNRETEACDLEAYQTVYARIKGSVAAPTAGLHFTPGVLAALEAKGFRREEVTLHVGAGTFKPVKSETIDGHEMHTEYISVSRQTIEHVRQNLGRIIAVGTTSVRTLESLYYIGARLARHPDAQAGSLAAGQWDPYDEANNRLSPAEALQHLLDYLDSRQADKLVASTRILIMPGYTFRVVRGIITNFHQPQSTLLLLVSAFVKDGNWRTIYDYALGNGFRFLSYGDSSLLL